MMRHALLTRLTVLGVIFMTMQCTLMAHVQRTTIKGKLELNEAQYYNLSADSVLTIKAPDHAVRLSGYDKPRNATRETIHATNQLKSFVIKDITLEISYRDNKDRELHHRTVTIPADIEPGHTQILSFPTWDRQHSFYYSRSAKPRAQATSYNINCKLISITIIRTTNHD